MLALVFEVDGIACGIPCAQVREVLPWMPMQSVPHSAPEVRGVLLYEGSVVGVADARMLIAKSPSRPRLSTRLVMFGDKDRRAGLLCEGTRGVLSLEHLAVQGSPPFLGPMFSEVMQGEGRLVHVVALATVLGLICSPQSGFHGAQTPA